MTIIPGSRFAASSRSSGGRAARASGRSLELAVFASQTDEHGRVVALVKIPEGGRVIRTPHGLQMVAQKSPFDYCGTFVGGKSICFDAKNCGSKQTSFQLGNDKVLKRHQISALEHTGEAGAVSGLLVCSERVGRYLWLPWHHLRDKPRIQWEDPA